MPKSDVAIVRGACEVEWKVYVDVLDPQTPFLSNPRISLSSDKLPVQLSVKSFVEWSVEDVCVWLDHLQLGQYKKTFIENDIQGKHLPDLSKEELKVGSSILKQEVNVFSIAI